VICASHSSSWLTGRAFSAGNEPTTPALHWAMTSSGHEMMNSGEAMTGRRKRSRSTAGRDMKAPKFSIAVPRMRKQFGTRRKSVADKMQHDLARVRARAMFEQIDALPGAERHLARDDGNGEVCLHQRAPQMA